MTEALRFGPAFAILVLFVAGCSAPLNRLETSERRTCVASGGYESHSAFGVPICQSRYADGGKACSDKTDCDGECRVDTDQMTSPMPQPGQSLQGVCQTKRYEPGCYVVIQGGKVSSEGAVCVD